MKHDETPDEFPAEVAANLPHALSGMVDDEHPSAELRERVAAGVTAGPSRSRRAIAPLAVAAALVVVALVAGVAGNGSGDDDVDLATDPSPSTTEEPDDPEVKGDVTRRTQTPAATDTTEVPIATTSTTAAPAPPPPPPTTAPPTIAPSPTTAPPPPTTAPPTTQPAPTTGSIAVEIQPAEGTSRWVQLFGGDGSPRSGRVAVTGEPILFPDLAPGDYAVVVEEESSGALTATRTDVTLAAGDDVRVRCDSAALGCARA